MEIENDAFNGNAEWKIVKLKTYQGCKGYAKCLLTHVRFLLPTNNYLGFNEDYDEVNLECLH